MKLDDWHRVAEFIRRGIAGQKAVDAELAKVVACEWCRTRPGETHFDPQGLPLFDAQHHAGRYITAAEGERISRDGP
jgi:hypothetical protein